MTSTEHETTADLQPSHGEANVDDVAQPVSHVTETEHSTSAATPAAESNAHASTPPSSTEPLHTENAVQNEPPPPEMPPRPAHEPGHDTNQGNTDMSPEVASLKAMFPDFDPIILQSVLESVGGSQDRAIDMLLGMSDPEYVPQQTAETRQLTQTELDEELARRLMLEEEEEQRYAGWDARGAGRGQQPPNWPQYGNVPYQPRTHGNHFPQGPQPQGQWGGDQQGPNSGQPQQGSAMNDVQEQFSKIAETGKKTFSSLVTKVKAKMQEFDQSRASSGQAGQQQSGSGAAQTGRGNPSPSQSQSYYDPNHGGYDTGANPTSGYDVTTNADAGRGPPPPVAVRPAETTGIAINDMRSQSPGVTTAATPRPPVTSTGAPVDPSKIGLLPKRPVSLVGASPQGSQTRPHEDEEELDYVENPFEDHRR
ncbi:hypothetical protein BD410DRAFT_784423 [Rickenella mellea]|uniref:CUE domain-containing protein n=1 Tax=Rickenella mellea TaxID=50990 RepID=A0A4Y7QHI8_9AGAM|nr:hypothetical protein BD410DRAFT_784423 [Rickenella mellea]